MSSIVSFTVGIIEFLRDRKIEGWVFVTIACLFLIVAFDQAWQDEHRNTEVLIAQRAEAEAGEKFWKTQSYDKDGALRSRDNLLAQNYTALIGEQTTANKSQESLTKLSDKILDISKPEPPKIDLQWTVLGEQHDKDNVVVSKTVIFIVRTNKQLPEVRHKLTCPFSFQFRTFALSQRDLLTYTLESGQDSANEASFSMQRAWLPTASLIVAAFVPQGDISRLGSCAITSKQ